MTHHNNTKIIGFVGLAGSGKTTAVEYFTEKGYPKVYFGGVIYDAMREASVDITPESQAIFREQIREKEGNDFVVKRIIAQIQHLQNAGQHRIIADGIYSWTEYKAMKQAFPGELVVVAIVTNRHLRHHRLSQRPERPFTATEATERDWREIEHLEKGGPIAMADYFVHNDGDIVALQQQIEAVLRHVEF